MRDLSVEIDDFDGASCIALRCKGCLDAHTFDQLEQEIFNVLEAGALHLIVDLSEITYISSAGIGVLIGSGSEAEERGSILIVLSPDCEIYRVIELTGLSGLIPIARSKHEALQLLKSAGREGGDRRGTS